MHRRGVSLVYLGRNDDDKEMSRMCTAIRNKLTVARIQVQEANAGSNDLPAPNTITYNEIWFCGHARFVEANATIRKSTSRTLGGFPLQDIASFLTSCIPSQGIKKVRLICCESAQQQ